MYKLSNLASKSLIEDFTRSKLRYPKLYRPRRKIDGLKEQNINILLMETPLEISFGIWGALPQMYEESWRNFQRLKSTLYVRANEINNSVLYRDALLKRRCLVVVTGFYTYELRANTVEKYLVEKPDRKPFYLAGVYNYTRDGFYTCSIISVNPSEQLNSINNLHETMPLQIPDVFKRIWLNTESTKEEIDYLISKPYETKFDIQKIAS